MLKIKNNQPIIKVAIVSFNKHSNHMNYGAVLHSYAFQKYLSNNGIDSVIIDYIPLSLEKYNFKYPILNNKRFWEIKPFLHSIVRWSIGFFANRNKYKKFQKFFASYYKLTKQTYTSKILMSSETIENLEIDTFVCESDVIWKIRSTNEKFDDVFFLNFPAAEGKRKVAYAPSLGSDPFTEKELYKFMSLTKDFHAISTREQQGAVYLQNILNRDIDWMLDPTLLLNNLDYEKILIEPKENNYLLVYNCMINDKKMIRQAKLLADKMNLKLIEISVFADNKLFFDHTIKTDVGVEEFLGYFKKASFIVCNAFHGMCFSIIFNKEFFLFLRDSTDYRMKNLTDALDLSDRIIHFENKSIPNKYNKIDFSEVDDKMRELKIKSYNFINENIINL